MQQRIRRTHIIGTALAVVVLAAASACGGNSGGGGPDARFVAAGTYVADGVVDGGTLLSSSDGATWDVATEVGSNLHGLAASDAGMVVAVGENDEEGLIVVGSPAGGWDTVEAGELDRMSGVAYHEGLWVAVGRRSSGGAGVLISNDGRSWDVAMNVDDPSGDIWLTGVAYGSSGWVAWGASDLTEPLVMTSDNGRDWTVAGETPDLVDAWYDSGMWVGGGSAGIVTSTDGVVWEQATVSPASTCSHVAGGAGAWYVSCDTQVFVSSDGRSWTEADTPDSATMGAAVRNGTGWSGFASLGTKHLATSSVDGNAWTSGAALPERFSGYRIVEI